MVKGSLKTKSKLIQVAMEKANAELEKTSLTPNERTRIINIVCKAMNPLVRELIDKIDKR